METTGPSATKDFLGRPIAIGDVTASPSHRGSSTWLTRGRVVAIKPNRYGRMTVYIRTDGKRDTEKAPDEVVTGPPPE